MPNVLAKKTVTKGARKSSPVSNPSDFSFSEVYRVEPIERIRLIREGIPARYIKVISDSMGITKDTLFKFLNLPKSTIDKKSVANQVLPIEQGERLIGMAKLVGQVESIVAESGNPAGFNAAKWVAQWLEKPSPALGGEKPSAFLDTVSGQEMISDLLAKIQTGAYA
jgi:putative toxin-antitoxin system antitoxin component (TIGR02293 family)